MLEHAALLAGARKPHYIVYLLDEALFFGCLQASSMLLTINVYRIVF